MVRGLRSYSVFPTPALLLAACGGQSSPPAPVTVPVTTSADIPNSTDIIVNDMKRR